jgi:hypothetical protein
VEKKYKVYAHRKLYSAHNRTCNSKQLGYSMLAFFHVQRDSSSEMWEKKEVVQIEYPNYYMDFSSYFT